MDFQQIMAMAGELKQKVDSAQAEAGTMRVSGEAGAGLVKVTVNGRHEIVSLKIDPQLLAEKDVTMTEDLIRAAINQAMSKVAGELSNRMGGLAESMGLDARGPTSR